MKKFIVLLLILVISFFSGCSNIGESLNKESKDPTDITKKSNQDVYNNLAFNDKSEFTSADFGFIEKPEALELYDSEGNIIFSRKAYSFIGDEIPSPETVNPSLWSNAQMNSYYGLYQVRPGIFQIRGYDITNITLIQGSTGWIVIDPMTTVECSKAAMQLIQKRISDKSVSAVMYTAPSVNYYGGVKGVVSEFEVNESSMPVIAPEGFENEAVKENMFTANVAAKREEYSLGSDLDKNEKGDISDGVGIDKAKGTVSYIPPNKLISNNMEEQVIDGVKMQFQLMPNNSMNVYCPDFKFLWLSENTASTLSGIYDLSSGNLTDGNLFSNALKDTVQYFGKNVEYAAQAHNWPHFGNSKIKEYILNTATAYKFIHDSTLNRLNKGESVDEIAKNFELPETLNKCWYLRQYTSTVAQNVRATKDQYLGYYSGNPIDLNPLSKSERAKKIIDYMGDTDEVLSKALDDYKKGEYQWVAEITNMLLYKDKANEKARYLCADALEQLGYQSESASCRNAYLSGARELREGLPQDKVNKSITNKVMRDFMSATDIFNLLGTMVDAEKASQYEIRLKITLDDTGETYALILKNSVLMYYNGDMFDKYDAQLKMNKEALFAIVDKDLEQQKRIINITGDQNTLNTIDSVLTKYEQNYSVMNK